MNNAIQTVISEIKNLQARELGYVADVLAKVQAGSLAPSALLDASLKLVELEGRADVYSGILSIVEYGRRNDVDTDETIEEVTGLLQDLLLRGADDSWSGRANDGRRARFDGTREAVRWAIKRVPSIVRDSAAAIEAEMVR